MTAANVAICPATPADLERVAGIFAHYVRNTVVTFETAPPAVTDWQRRLDDLAGLGLPFLVARTGGEVAGYAYAGPWRRQPAYRHTVEDSVYLAPGRTGQGLGRRLLGELLTRCGQAGARQVVAVIADAGPDSEASIALHRSFGFAPAGRLAGVGHKHGRWIDTVLMQRDLTTLA
jgi:L-amino acid N-acyltransferase YncA